MLPTWKTALATTVSDLSRDLNPGYLSFLVLTTTFQGFDFKKNFYYSTMVVVSQMLVSNVHRVQPYLGGSRIQLFQWVETSNRSKCFMHGKKHDTKGTPQYSICYMGVSKNIQYPKMDGLWKTLLNWMIWGYPYFRKQPHKDMFPGDLWYICGMCTDELSSTTSTWTLVNVWFNMPIASTVWSKGQASIISR